jgi:hypothetical protein
VQHIDLKAILEQTRPGLNGNLVTRPTGRAVRGSIEQALADSATEPIAVIDFGTVRCLDYSCADEIVARLLREHGRARYFFLQGVSPSHCDAIDHVLERHALTVIARDRDGRIRVLGPTPDHARMALAELAERGLATVEELTEQSLIGEPLPHRPDGQSPQISG